MSRKVPNHELDFISQACHVLDVPAEHVWCKHMRLEIRPVPLREHSRPIGTEPLPKASSASPGTLRVQPRRQPKEKRTVRDVEDICIFGESARDSLRACNSSFICQGFCRRLFESIYRPFRQKAYSPTLLYTRKRAAIPLECVNGYI